MRVLVLYYSQTGQLSDIVGHCLAPLIAAPDVEVDRVMVETEVSFPFPWTKVTFFNLFPESVEGVPFAMKPIAVDVAKDYDLIVLGYTVWYLQPSVPISSLLQHPDAGRIFKGKKVVTLIGSRNMWVLAQERVKQHLHRLGAELVGNIALLDRNPNLISILSIIRWMFYGKKEAGWGLPEAGIIRKDIEDSSRFGEILLRHLRSGSYDGMQGELNAAGAVNISPALLLLEHRATRIFKVYARYIAAKGDYSSPARVPRVKVLAWVIPVGAFILSPLTALATAIASVVRRSELEREIDYHKQNGLRDRA